MPSSDASSWLRGLTVQVSSFSSNFSAPESTPLDARVISDVYYAVNHMRNSRERLDRPVIAVLRLFECGVDRVSLLEVLEYSCRQSNLCWVIRRTDRGTWSQYIRIEQTIQAKNAPCSSHLSPRIKFSPIYTISYVLSSPSSLNASPVAPGCSLSKILLSRLSFCLSIHAVLCNLNRSSSSSLDALIDCS